MQSITEQDKIFMRRAIELAEKGMTNNEGGPFGAVIVNAAGVIVGEGNNLVTSTNDPTAHAEVTAIRNACQNLGPFQLTGCTIYTSCEPCPMCFYAAWFTGISKVVYGINTRESSKLLFEEMDISTHELNERSGNKVEIKPNVCHDEIYKLFEDANYKGI